MRFVFALAVLAIAACATEKAPPEAPPSKKFDHIDASNIEAAQKAGYKIVNENGTKLYCRKDAQLGSRLKTKTTCLTEAEWLTAQQNGREMVRPSMQGPLDPNGSH
jgi:hypothetical protein